MSHPCGHRFWRASRLPQTRRRCNPFQDHEATIAAQTPLLRGYLPRAQATFPWEEAVEDEPSLDDCSDVDYSRGECEARSGQ
jgi:hypothetical protein